MKISTKGRYATRAMLELALRKSSLPVRLKDIARTQRISVKYLENIFISLKQAKLLESTIGMRGGYILTKAPSRIKILEIVEAMEGNLAPVECVRNPKSCPRIAKCVTHKLWKKVGHAVQDTLASTTLEDLADEYTKTMKLSQHPTSRQ